MRRRFAMNSSKRFQLTVLVVVAVALFAAAPAFAQKTIGPFTLTNVTAVGDPDHLATGQETITFCSGLWAHLTVTCQGLTPGQLYRIGPLPYWDRNFRIFYSYRSFTASADGSGRAVAQVAARYCRLQSGSGGVQPGQGPVCDRISWQCLLASLVFCQTSRSPTKGRERGTGALFRDRPRNTSTRRRRRASTKDGRRTVIHPSSFLPETKRPVRLLPPSTASSARHPPRARFARGR